MIHCKVCSHPLRAEIEHALAATTMPLRALGQQYGMSRTSLWRHNHAHTAPDRRRAARPQSSRDQAVADFMAKWGQIKRVLRAARQ